MIFLETCFNYCDPNEAFFSSDERKWINKIRKLKEEHPDEIEIIAQPETNDGCIYCKLPAAWLKVQPKLKRELSDEERQILSDRMKNIRKQSGK